MSYWTMTTTSRRQGQHREALSEGSPSAKIRADGQEPHRRPSAWARQPGMPKPAVVMTQGKCGGCVPKVHVLIRGDLPVMRSPVNMGAGMRPVVKTSDTPPDPAVAVPTALRGAIRAVNRQKSADGIVAGRGRNAPTAKARTL